MDADSGHLQRKTALKQLVRAIDQLERERHQSHQMHSENIRQLGELMEWTVISPNEDFEDRILKTRSCCRKLQQTETELGYLSAEVLGLQDNLESLMEKDVSEALFSEHVLQICLECSQFEEKHATCQRLKENIDEHQVTLRNLAQQQWKEHGNEEQRKEKYEHVKKQCERIEESQAILSSIERRAVELDGQLDNLLNATQPISPMLTSLEPNYAKSDFYSFDKSRSSIHGQSSDSAVPTTIACPILGSASPDYESLPKIPPVKPSRSVEKTLSTPQLSAYPRLLIGQEPGESNQLKRSPQWYTAMTTDVLRRTLDDVLSNAPTSPTSHVQADYSSRLSLLSKEDFDNFAAELFKALKINESEAVGNKEDDIFQLRSDEESENSLMTQRKVLQKNVHLMERNEEGFLDKGTSDEAESDESSGTIAVQESENDSEREEADIRKCRKVVPVVVAELAAGSLSPTVFDLYPRTRLDDGHCFVEVPMVWDEEDDEQGQAKLETLAPRELKVKFNLEKVKVFSTYNELDYDRSNDEVDPVAASIEYELEKHIEKIVSAFPMDSVEESDGGDSDWNIVDIYADGNEKQFNHVL